MSLRLFADALEHVTRARDRMNSSCNALFSSLRGYSLESNSTDFKQTITSYGNSAFFCECDDKIDAFFNLYRNRAWHNDIECFTVTTHHRNFINALLKLRTIYFDNQSNDVEERKRLDFTINLTEDLLTALLESTYYSNKRQQENLKAITLYKNICENTLTHSKIDSFVKAAATVFLTALIYLSVSGAIYLYQKEQTPFKFAKQTCGIHSYDSLSRHLTFRPTEIQSTTQEIAKLALIESVEITQEWLILK